MRIFIKSLNGKSITVEVQPSDTIKSLKSKVFDKLQVPPDNQRLLYSSSQLEDKKTLADYGIEANATIHFVVRVPGGLSGLTYCHVRYCTADSVLRC